MLSIYCIISAVYVLLKHVTVPANLFACTFSPSTSFLRFSTRCLRKYGSVSTRSMLSIYNPCAVFALLRHVTEPAYLFHAPSVLLRLCSSTWCQCYSTSGSPTPTCGLIFYIYSFPTQALMAEMCAWQPFTHQTEIYNPSTTSTWTLTSDWVCSLRLHLHTYFANIFNAVNEHPPSNKHFFRTAFFHLSTTYVSLQNILRTFSWLL